MSAGAGAAWIESRVVGSAVIDVLTAEAAVLCRLASAFREVADLPGLPDSA